MLQEIHAAGIGMIRPREDRDGMVIRANHITWGPKSALNRAVEVTLTTADMAFILNQATRIYGADTLVRAIMAAERNPYSIPVKELSS